MFSGQFSVAKTPLRALRRITCYSHSGWSGPRGLFLSFPDLSNGNGLEYGFSVQTPSKKQRICLFRRGLYSSDSPEGSFSAQTQWYGEKALKAAAVTNQKCHNHRPFYQLYPLPPKRFCLSFRYDEHPKPFYRGFGVRPYSPFGEKHAPFWIDNQEHCSRIISTFAVPLNKNRPWPIK